MTTIKVERCEAICPAWTLRCSSGNEQYRYAKAYCRMVVPAKEIPDDRRKFPRWCPLLKGKVTVEKA